MKELNETQQFLKKNKAAIIMHQPILFVLTRCEVKSLLKILEEKRFLFFFFFFHSSVVS